jgi:soluble lytic murein transglycosylase
LSTLLLTNGSVAHAAEDVFTKARELTEAGKKDEALKLLQAEIQKGPKGSEQELLPFSIAMVYYKSADYDKALAAYDDFLKRPNSLEEYAYFYKAMSEFKLNKFREAQADFKKVEELSPNAKLKIDSISMLGQIALQHESYKEAKGYFQKIEKRTRNTEDYPEVVYFLALSEQGLGKHAAMCNWATKLYGRYPSHPRVENWGFDLAENKIGTKATNCSSDLSDFKLRVRYLIFAGLDKKAQAEITQIRERLVKEDPFLADQLQAQYFAQEGELTKAYDLLKGYYDQKKNNFTYLISFASVAARAGEVQAAVGSYYAAYKMSPHQAQSKEALYQSAFLSYQFQDYDGATRRFKEFMRVYPKSALNVDARWQLAWLKYLKGDYPEAYKAFSQLQNEKRKGRRHVVRYPTDRLNYWMAMSLFRQGKYDGAKARFQALTKDSLMGYYAIAAQYRLKKIEALQPKMAARTAQNSLALRWARGPAGASEYLIPSVDDTLPELAASADESEEGIVLQEFAEEAQNAESAESADNGDGNNADVKQLEVSEMTEGITVKEQSNAVLSKRFEKARDLMTVGLDDWAKWDLYDIEKRTRNKDFMKSLMTEYNSVGHFNRSSYIGQVFFSGQRSASGLEGGRNLWEYAYPRAFSQYVDKYSKDFSIPNELVWGIMRAESQYRKDAISPVGALGLMQVMPFTGYRVANLLGDKNFQPRQLLEPDAAIKMGARYLQRLMLKFDNTIPLVAAGYNAGPHRVNNWLHSFGHLETDEFIEHIPFLETRNYVKKVVSNCYVYSQLYSNKKDLFGYLVEPVPFKKVGTGGASQKEDWDDI